jgi:hypothetical protein
MKPRACHTSMKTGARVIAFLRDGSQIVGKYVERKGRFVVLDNARIPTDKLRQLAYYKAA